MTPRPQGPEATRRRSGHSPGRLLPIGVILLLLAAPAAADTIPDAKPGATVESVLAIARRLSPELAARALETEAAQARVEIAGAWSDPTLRITSDEIDRVSGPRQNKMIYGIEQDIPLWGKRDLKRDAARAEVNQMTAESRSAEADLIEKVKVAFAQYYQAQQAIKTTRDLHGVVHDIGKLARARYAQNRGTQQEVFKAEIESTRIETEIARLDASSRAASGRLNALLLRPIDAPLAEPQQLRSLPPLGALRSENLAERARSTNPGLQSNSAMIAGADSNRRLAEKGWLPDITIGAAAIDRTGNGPNGYMATIGLKVPLQYGLHSAQEREAKAKLEAARSRQRAIEQQIEGDLAEYAASLSSSRATADLIRTQLLPKSETLVRSGIAAYTAGRAELTDVLMAEHDLADIRVQLLSAEFDAQRQLAAIERLIGGDL